MAKEMPDHASPKKAIVKKTSKMPITPVVTVAPNAYARPKIIADCKATLNASLVNLPNKIAGRRTGVTSIFWRKPESISRTIDVPD